MVKSLKISSRIENLRKVEKLIDDISTEYNLSSEVYGNVLIATLEAANNAILHGNKLDKLKEVNISIKLDKHVLSIEIKDQGKGFNFKTIPDPTSPENIENINGRGVFLMERLSDEIEFFEEGRRVELKFNLV